MGVQHKIGFNLTLPHRKEVQKVVLDGSFSSGINTNRHPNYDVGHLLTLHNIQSTKAILIPSDFSFIVNFSPPQIGNEKK
jgi:hypothetical protein